MSVALFVNALRRAWCAETSATGRSKGCAGQCAVTALVVQDTLGGEILRADVGGSGHYWNLVPGVGEVDLTREQFGREEPIPRGVIVPRSRLLEGERAAAARTPERYALLRARLRGGL